MEVLRCDAGAAYGVRYMLLVYLLGILSLLLIIFIKYIYIYIYIYIILSVS